MKCSTQLARNLQLQLYATFADLLNSISVYEATKKLENNRYFDMERILEIKTSTTKNVLKHEVE